MRRVASLALVVVALLGIGLWTAFGERWTASSGAAGPGPTPSGSGPAEADAAAADAAPDGWSVAPFLADAPVRAFDAPEPVLEDGLDYGARIETTAGTLLVDLYERRVPTTVNAVVFLALHRYYEDVPFHRVIEDFMAQTGDPTGTGSGGPGFTFDDEIVDGLTHDRGGLLSMANAGPDTNGSQFFLTFGPTPWLDGRHAVFGEILEGADVLDRLTRVDPASPSIVASLADPAADLATQGVDEAEGVDGTVRSWLEARLGSVPATGQSFHLGARRGVVGTVAGAPAVGLFPVPDRIERVTVLTRPQEATP